MVESRDGSTTTAAERLTTTRAPTFLWYYDDDNDGLGCRGLLAACNGPVGYVSDRPTVMTGCRAYPNAPEYCDGVDTTGNGIDDDSAIDVLTYADQTAMGMAI